MLDLNKGLLLSFAVNSRSKWRPIFVTGHVPLSHTLERTARPDLPRIWLVRRFGSYAGPRAFPKGTLHLNLNGEPIASPFAPGFNCKIRDFIAKYLSGMRHKHPAQCHGPHLQRIAGSKAKTIPSKKWVCGYAV